MGLKSIILKQLSTNLQWEKPVFTEKNWFTLIKTCLHRKKGIH